MSKIRIYELAKQLGVANKDLVAKINSIGIEAKSHMAMLTEEEAAKVTALYQPKKEEPKKDAPKKDAPKQNQPKQNQQKQDGQKKENDRRQDGNRPAQKKDNRNEGRARAIITTITIIITSRAVRITRAHSSRARRTTIKARTKKTKRATRTVRR